MQIGRLCRPLLNLHFDTPYVIKKHPGRYVISRGAFFIMCVNYLTITLVALFAIFTI